mmetsp:Transcript_7488/g.33061  ORF Transcript_7488/g.33061 Transcript_7488/m.33061 type:complete len:334 (+) Transcript_7488:914-1915(+)
MPSVCSDAAAFAAAASASGSGSVSGTGTVRRIAARSTASGYLSLLLSAIFPARSREQTARTNPRASPSSACSHRVRDASNVALAPALAIITLTSAAVTRSPSGSIAFRALSNRTMRSSIAFIVSSAMSPPCGASYEDAVLPTLRKSEAVAESRCTGMPSVRRSKRSARICSCLRCSSCSFASSSRRFFSRSRARSMLRSRSGLTRLNISAIIASRSVGSMSFCRRPLSGLPRTIGSSADSSSPLGFLSKFIPAFSAASLASCSSSCRRRRSASGSSSSLACDAGFGPSHTRVFSRRYAFRVRPGRSALFQLSRSLGSTSLSLAISSSFWEPLV